MSGEDFDPQTLARNMDAIKLSKKDIRLVIAALKKRWAKNYRANAKYIAAATAIQGGLMMTSEETVSVIWTETVKALYELILLNAAKGSERPDMVLLRQNLIDRIERGEVM